MSLSHKHFDVHGSCFDNAVYPHALRWTRGSGPHGVPCLAVAAGSQIAAWHCIAHGAEAAQTHYGRSAELALGSVPRACPVRAGVFSKKING